MRFTKILAAVAITAALGLAAPSAAQAALPHCTDWTESPDLGGYMAAPSLGNNTWKFDCILSTADGASHKPAVFVLQMALKLCQGQDIAVDGIFGSATRNAVINTQRWWHVTADGVYGPATRDAMLWPYMSHDNVKLGCYGFSEFTPGGDI
jgi:peptidoglycan hydrolase-like protein with peptidoglycan-binding domain